MTTKSNAWVLIGFWLKESHSYKENWGNNWEIDSVGCILAKKVNIDRILNVMMVFKCLGCHFVDSLLSNGSEKSVCMWERAQVGVFIVNREDGYMGAY